jgi:hypothetical protein
MDRKGIIGITIAMLVLLVWQIEFAPKYMPPPHRGADRGRHARRQRRSLWLKRAGRTGSAGTCWQYRPGGCRSRSRRQPITVADASSPWPLQ